MKNRVLRRWWLLGLAVLVGAGVLATSGLGAPPPDPISAVRYSITIDGFEIGSFSELGGITTEIVPPDYLATPANGVILNKLPGKVKPPTIVLKRGLTSSLELSAWHDAALKGQATARKSVSLVAYNAEGSPVARWFLERAWPTKLEISGLKAGASAVLIETVTLTADYVQRVAPG
jgi:phage tail-like protein